MVKPFPSLPSGDFIAGLVEGEGCFSLKFRREVKRNRRGSPEYFGWQAAFAIVLRKDDTGLLKKAQRVLGCGKLSFSRNAVRFQVQDIDKLLKFIIPFFEHHRLHGKKYHDFILWKESILLINKNKKKGVNVRKGVRGFVQVPWSKRDIRRLREIRNQMRTFKSDRPPFKWE